MKPPSGRGGPDLPQDGRVGSLDVESGPGLLEPRLGGLRVLLSNAQQKDLQLTVLLIIAQRGLAGCAYVKNGEKSGGFSSNTNTTLEGML